MSVSVETSSYGEGRGRGGRGARWDLGLDVWRGRRKPCGGSEEQPSVCLEFELFQHLRPLGPCVALTRFPSRRDW